MAGNDEHQQMRTEQTDVIYRAIGRFTVAFSQMVHAMEMNCIMMLSRDSRSQRYANVALAELAAGSIQSMFFALCAEHLEELTPSEREIRKLLDNAVAASIRERNKVAHSTWFVGWGNERTTDWSKPEVVSIRRSSEGAFVRASDYNAGSLDKLSEGLDDLGGLLRLFGTCCYVPDMRPDCAFEIVEGKVTRRAGG